jgi:hypothetical protein
LNLDESDSFSKYLTSIYFALVVSFTVGYGDIVARTLPEYIFVVFYLIIGVSLYSYTISNLTSLFGRLSERENYLQERENAIREFAINHNLSEDLYLEVRNYLLDNDTNKIQNFLADKNNITNINELTDSLPANLYYELYVNNFKSHLKKFPFLRDSDDKFYFLFISLFEIRLFNKNDIIFKQGDEAREVFILWKGKFCLVNSHNFESFDDYLERKKPIISKYNQENNNHTLIGGISKSKIKPKIRRKYLEEKEKNMMYFTEGDLIGENDVKKSDGKVRKFTLKAEEDSVAIIISVHDLKYLCEIDEKFKNHIDDTYKKKERVIKLILNSKSPQSLANHLNLTNLKMAEKLFRSAKNKNINLHNEGEKAKLLKFLMNNNKDYKFLETLIDENSELIDPFNFAFLNSNNKKKNDIFKREENYEREMSKSCDENAQIIADRLLEKILDANFEEFNNGFNLNLISVHENHGNNISQGINEPGDLKLNSPYKTGINPHSSSKFGDRSNVYKEGNLPNQTFENINLKPSLKSKSNFSSFSNSSSSSSGIKSIKTKRISLIKSNSPSNHINSTKKKQINSKKMNMIKDIFNLSPMLKNKKRINNRINQSCIELPVSINLENFEFVNIKKKQDHLNIQLLNLLNLKKFQLINSDIFPVVHEVNLLFRKIFKTMKNYISQFEELRRMISLNNQDSVREVMYSINEIFSMIYGIIDIINKIKTVKLNETLTTFHEYSSAIKAMYDDRIDRIQEANDP